VRRPVQWSRDALDDLKSQVAHIAADDPRAARRIAERILSTAAALGEHAIGRPGRVVGTYEKSVSRMPYVIAYAVRSSAEAEIIAILRVIHTARDWPAGRWPV